MRQVAHLLFCIGAVRFIYEVRPSYYGLGWSAFFQSSRACSSGTSSPISSEQKALSASVRTERPLLTPPRILS